MKKTIIIFLTIFIIIIVIAIGYYIRIKNAGLEISEFNLEYEQYTENAIYGTDLTTVINNAVNNNEQNSVEKDEEGYYIQNDTNSVIIEIKIIDLEEDTIYKMETFYNGGMDQFVQYYGEILFQAESVEYNSAGKISYILFEQISA